MLSESAKEKVLLIKSSLSVGGQNHLIIILLMYIC